MRKQTKLVAVLSAAALMAMGASMTAFADWSQEDGEWVYLDRNGDRVTDEWRRSNGQWYYLDEDGYMLSGWQRWSRSGESEKLYYLGGQNEGWARTGWQYLTIDPDIDAFNGINEDDDDYNDEEWFYFKSDGKAVENDDRVVNGRTYIFDEYGRMLDLWVYKDATSASASGAFTNVDGTSTATDSQFYHEDNGDRGKNWIYAYPATDYDDYSDDPYWFYLDSNGKPFRAIQETVDKKKLTAIGSAYRVDDDNVADADDPEYNGAVGAKSIKSETYLFNSKGVMLTGLYWLGGDDEGDTNAKVYKGTSKEAMDPGYYYFNTEDGSVNGQMVTNKKVTIEVDGEDEQYYFKKSGAAYTKTIISGTVYGDDGQRIDEYGDGSTYQIVTLDYDLWEKGDEQTEENIAVPAGSQILLNENGKIKKSGTVTDINDQKVKVSNYVVTSVEEDD